MLNKLGSQITREFKGVENVYTQHSPLLKLTVEELLKGALCVVVTAGMMILDTDDSHCKTRCEM